MSPLYDASATKADVVKAVEKFDASSRTLAESQNKYSKASLFLGIVQIIVGIIQIVIVAWLSIGKK